MMKTLAVVVLTVSLFACGGPGSTFYVTPCEGQYCVKLHGIDMPPDETVSKAMSLEDASALAKKLNQDMGDNWSMRMPR